MVKKKTLDVPLNRVEGDLEIRVELTDDIVSDAWTSGIMYRGFEQIMVGRGALDGLVITPRICGICTTSHLAAAAKALDMIAGVSPPPDAIRVRNLALMTEHVMSDVRHGFMMYAADFVNPAYKNHPLYEEAVRRYEPFKGETVMEVVRETKKILGLIAIVGGQWPHSTYMVPGGIVSVPSGGDLLQCRLLLRQYRKWYERRILGCAIERFMELKSQADLENWLEESKDHHNSDLGFYIRFARSIGLDQMGGGHENFISYGSLVHPEGSRVECPADDPCFLPGGFAQGTRVSPIDQKNVTEYVDYSWFEDYQGGKHPFEGLTKPYASGREGRKYSWAKAPRYNDLPAETGPLAEAIIEKNPLATDLYHQNGPNAFLRELARLIRPAKLIPAMETWLSEITPEGTFYTSPGEIVDGQGFGLTHATRGSLGHWVRLRDGSIEHYQIITPTAWHASPRDARGVRGPMEEAVIGVRIKDLENPVELGHVIRSYDACLVCTVHAFSEKRPKRRPTIQPGR